jgi:pimeloyl-ACP methyl ester carboxylesterase
MALELAFEESGVGPPLVILHGLFGSSHNWRGIARQLAPTNRVITADLRNHGASPWAATMDYPAMADDVRMLIERTCDEPPTVVGHSMGGKTAMALALLHPQRVARLVVVDIAPIVYADTLTACNEAMRSVDIATAATRAEVQRRLARRVPDPGIVPFMTQNLSVRNDHFDWRLNLAAIGASMQGLCAFPAELAALCYGGPVSVIAGGRSDYVPRKPTVFAPMFPLVRVEFIETAGHWVHADCPADFSAALRRAL